MRREKEKEEKFHFAVAKLKSSLLQKFSSEKKYIGNWMHSNVEIFNYLIGHIYELCE